MSVAFSPKLRFSEAVSIFPFRNNCGNWLQNVEIDKELPPLRGPRWVYAFRRAKERFQVAGVMTFDEQGGLEVGKGGSHLKPADGKGSGAIDSVSFSLNPNGAPSLWMFVASSFALSELSLRELCLFNVTERQANGTYYAFSRVAGFSHQRLPIVDLSAKPILQKDRKLHHWGGSVFDDGRGGQIILAIDFLAIARRLHARAYKELEAFLELSHPALIRDINPEKDAAIELQTLEVTLARFLDGVCRQNPGMLKKFRPDKLPADIVDKFEKKIRKRNIDAQRAMARHCAFIESAFFDLVCTWFELSGAKEPERILDDIQSVLDGLEYSPRGLATLADPPEHFIRLLHTARITDGPTRKAKDYVSFGRKHVKSIVEFATKFAPGFIVGSRLHREFRDIFTLLWIAVEPQYEGPRSGIMPSTVPMGSPAGADLIIYVSKEYESEVGAKALRDTIKTIGKAVDTAHWLLVIQDIVTKDKRDIYDYAKAINAVNGALKTYVWEAWAKGASGPKGEPKRLVVHLDDWMRARKSLAAALGATDKVAAKKLFGKLMLRAAPGVGALCEFISAHGEYTKSRQQGDDVAAIAGAATGVLAGLGGLIALVPASWLATSGFLTAFVPGVGWALLTAAAAAAVVAWIATDDDWENLAEHTIFGKRNLMDQATKPNWAFREYGLWNGSAEGIRRQIMSAYALLCKIEIRSWGDGIEVKLHHYEPDMELVVIYFDSLIDQQVQVTVDLGNGSISGQNVDLVDVLPIKGGAGRYGSVRIKGKWRGLIRGAMQLVHREVSVQLLQNSPSTTKMALPPTPLTSKAGIQVRRSAADRLGRMPDKPWL